MMEEVEIPLLFNEDQPTIRSLINLCALDMTCEGFQFLIWLVASYENPSFALAICCVMSIYSFISSYSLQQNLVNTTKYDPFAFWQCITITTGTIITLISFMCVYKQIPFGAIPPSYVAFIASCQLYFTYEKLTFIPPPNLILDFVMLYKHHTILYCFFTLTLLLGCVMDVYGSPSEPCLPILLILYGCSQITIATK
jgi:hypothetical protein